MDFDSFKKVEQCYKHLASGNYIAKEVNSCYKLLPEEFQVSPANKNEKIASIKVYFEQVFTKAMEEILPMLKQNENGTE